MIAQPIFKPHIRPVVVAGTGVFLATERGYRMLQGRLCEALLPLVDGKRTADEIVDALQPKFSATHVYYALLLLEQEGYLTECDQHESPANVDFWSLQGFDARRVKCKLASTSVSIIAPGSNLAKRPLNGALMALGVQTGDEGDLTVALVDDYLEPGLETINLNAIRNEHSWILAKPTGSDPWIGPVFSPSNSACWECLAHRLRERRDLELSLLKGNEAPVPVCHAQVIQQIVYNILATEIVKWIISEQQCGLCGTLLSLDTRSWQTKKHVVVRRPECSVCGTDLHQTVPLPVELGNSTIRFFADGGYRCNTPEETLQRYGHHVSSITGAVRALYRHPHATDATIAYLTVNSHAARERPHAATASRNCSGGKGMTAMQAKASALCEALERYSGVYRGYEPSVISSLRALGDRAIHPNSCMLYSDEQYSRRTECNAHRARYNIVPEPFNETMQVRWAPVWSLSRKEFRFLPTAYCYFSYSDWHNSPSEIDSCRACSNGNAAGNTLAEAILQGFLELVERDSVGIWWYNSLHRPDVDLSTFSEPYFGKLQEHYQQVGRRLWVLDITSDLQIPAFAAICSKVGGEGPILLGFGCHLDARLAICRALTEMNQMFLATVSFDAGLASSFSAVDEETANWMKSANLANHPHVVPNPLVSRRTAVQYKQWCNGDVYEAISECRLTIERHGLEMLVLDQTRAEIGLPVVKVIVPGLRHFWARFAPGRLYEVPVKMGWLSVPRREDELNGPAICF